MNIILLVAFIGLVVGFFLLFGISPMEFTEGIFTKILAKPNSIKSQINEATKRKKPNVFRREISEAQEILRLTNRSHMFGILCACSLGLSAIGVCVAVAIGNAHGNYPVLPELRFDVLEEIHKKVSTPLVLHGGTGISDEQFQRAISLGVRKINIATASFDNLAAYAKAYCDNKEKANYFELSACEVEGVYQNVKRHIKVFNME